MNTTTMDDTAGMDAGMKQPSHRTVPGILHQVLLAGLGAVAFAGEGAAKAAVALVAKGRQVEPKVSRGVGGAATEVRHGLKDLAGKVSRGAERAEGVLDQKVAERLRRTGFPTREEIDELARKVEELSARLAMYRAAATEEETGAEPKGGE